VRNPIGMASGATGRRWTALAICGIAVVMPGCSCSFSVGGDTVDQSSEVSQAKKTLGSLPHLPSTQSLDCPDDVEAKADTTYECQATLTNGQEVTLPARVASVHGDDMNLENNLDLVLQALALEAIYASADTTPKSVECPTDVPATVGKTFDCRVTFKDGSTTATLKVESTTPRQNLRIVAAHKD
jgi:hypothetical protein